MEINLKNRGNMEMEEIRRSCGAEIFGGYYGLEQVDDSFLLQGKPTEIQISYPICTKKQGHG